MITLTQFANSNKEFIDWCIKNSKETTKRQASKYLKMKNTSLFDMYEARFKELDNKARETYIEQDDNPGLYYNQKVEKGIFTLVKQSMEDDKGLKAYQRAMTDLSFMHSEENTINARETNAHFLGRKACIVS